MLLVGVLQKLQNAQQTDTAVVFHMVRLLKNRKGTSAGLCTCGVPFSIFCFDYTSGVAILQQEDAQKVSLICGSSIFLFIIFII